MHRGQLEAFAKFHHRQKPGAARQSYTATLDLLMGQTTHNDGNIQIDYC